MELYISPCSRMISCHLFSFRFISRRSYCMQYDGADRLRRQSGDGSKNGKNVLIKEKIGMMRGIRHVTTFGGRKIAVLPRCQEPTLCCCCFADRHSYLIFIHTCTYSATLTISYLPAVVDKSVLFNYRASVFFLFQVKLPLLNQCQLH